MTPAEIVRTTYEALGRGDLEAIRASFAEDAVWHLPGRSAVSGSHRGWPAIRDVLARLGPLSGGSFRAELLDVCEGETYVVAVQRATAERDGLRLDVTGCQLIRVEEGKIAELRGHYSDQYALDAFWS